MKRDLLKEISLKLSPALILKWFNPKITAKQLVKNILRTFRPSTGAIFNANNVLQTGWLATTPYWHKNEHTKSDGHVLNKRRGKDLESKFKLGFNCWMQRDSRMRSLDLSGELVRICGLLKSTLWFGFDCKWLHTSELRLVWCSSRRFTKFRRVWPI